MPLRVPEELHRDIQLEAKKQGMSLNQYCLFLLSRYTPKSEDAWSRRGEELLEFIAQAQHLQTAWARPSKNKSQPIFSLKRRLKKLNEKN